jgi:hypothetical protein
VVRLRRTKRRPVFLHIGAMKTGTTFLQNLMEANQAGLAEAGVVFPGRRWIDQDRAARDVLGFVADPNFAASSRGMWQRLTAEMTRPGAHNAVFSMEFLSYADAEHARRVVASFPDSDVHVILTVRDAVRTFPAQWQTQCANMGKVTWPRFLQSARQIVAGEDSDTGAARKFQRSQGIPRMLEVWAPLVRKGNLHVVTVPPSGSPPRLLWNRFASVIGVDPAVCPVDPVRVNTSMGYPSAELLRRVNTSLGGVLRSDYDPVVKVRLARDTLAPRSSHERPTRLHRPGHNLAASWNAMVRAAIDEHAVDVVGSLDELPTARAGDGVPATIERPDVDELLAAAAAAEEGLLSYRAELRGQTQGEPPSSATASPAAWHDSGSPLDSAVSDVTGLARDCIELVHARSRVALDATQAT